MYRKTQFLMIAVCFLALVVGEIKANAIDVTLKAHFQKIRQVVLCKYLHAQSIHLFIKTLKF